jgi:hypothetical protein
MTIRGDQVKTPYGLHSGRKPYLSRLRTFGYRVYVEPPRPHRPAKSEIADLKNLLYFDLESHEVKSAQHARYDEGMNGVPDPPSNARLVRFTQRGEPFPNEATLLETLDLDVPESPFQDLRTLSVLAGGEDSYLGFVFFKCSHRLVHT